MTCDHHDTCVGNHVVRSSDYFCDHDEQCDEEHD
jgi:hypothetical protein